MSWTRRFIYAFWAFVVIMLLWEAYQYHSNISRVDPDHPTQQHFYFIHTNSHATVAAPVRRDGPDVQQTAFTVEDNVPGFSSFTCHVTLKNKGTVKATNVQVQVRPFRGISRGSDDVGRGGAKKVDENNPLALLNVWVSFPDLAPGASATESAVFTRQTGASPGSNPSPQITFTAERK